ncbi:mechanosensitive ion channel family protein [Trichothermofontia sichuanensis B231]|uniref:mechanosensitive ion channel family protein n=1 Tax=Trichothermofontia sichuanensis TaxID=3045816 RepID=UPI002246D876|nr:mechanosensitive ion channel family protein [Trichothermofontia sichuanensis]UZQ53658.1 mechanosensitive ion channel family protein [Trichothermofontia sichuanensis B231]
MADRKQDGRGMVKSRHWVARGWRRWLGFCLAMGLGYWLAWGGIPGMVHWVVPAGMAQVQPGGVKPIAPSASQPTPTPTPTTQFPLNLSLPPELERFFSNRPSMSQAAVSLDGQPLFQVAALDIATGDDPAADSVSVQARVRLIESRLNRIATRGFDPNTLAVQIAWENQQPVLIVNSRADGRTYQDTLLTVTDLDARLHETDMETLAQEWAATVEAALRRFQQERQPTFLRHQLLVAAALFTMAAILSLLLRYWQHRLHQERDRLAPVAHTEPSPLTATDRDTPPTVTTTLLQQQLQNRQRRSVLAIQQLFAVVGQVLLWFSTVFLILGLFPYTRWLQPLLLRLINIPGRLLAIAALFYVLMRLSVMGIDRIFTLLQEGPEWSPEQSQRRALRFSTFASVLKGVAVAILAMIGAIVGLSSVGVQIAPLLAGAGIVGLGISLAAQNLIRDIINGCLILLEDQYGVGDVIRVGEVSGLVEYMGLRMTQLRDTDGRLITVPNSSITIVQNLTKEWSRVDLMITVALTADLEKALQVIQQVAQEMRSVYPWQALILDTPQLLGVEHLDHVGATIRLWIKTLPQKQWEVAREYRRRLKLAFDREGIAIGVPQQSVWFHSRVTPLPPDRMTPPGEAQLSNYP